MSLTLRFLLIIGSIIGMIYLAVRIRKSDVRIMDMFSWIIMSIILVLIALFPNGVIWLAHSVGFEAPVNFVFLVIICFLIIKCFSLTIQLSKEREKVKNAIEEISIKIYESDKRHENEDTIS